MLQPSGTKYIFARGERGIFVEIYFPKKAVYQGAIFDALSQGYEKETEEKEESQVKKYLHKNAQAILEELADYQGLFDPCQENANSKTRKHKLTIADVHERINRYVSCFQGWSMYEVDGVWFAEDGRVDEERTQVVRLMFRLPSTYHQEAIDAGYFDVFRSILYWTISSQGHHDKHVPWSKAEQTLFLKHHHHWTKGKQAFVRKYFAPISQEVAKWIDDCALFIFGYLVRKFAEQVLATQRQEDQIWVTSFFNLTLNIVKSVQTEPTA